jgi:hypothetical protein
MASGQLEISIDELSKRRTIDFRQRIQIERFLFASLREILASYCDIHFDGFSPDATARARDALRASDAPAEVASAVIEAIELRVILKHLASSKAYYVDDLGGPDLPGRRAAVGVFARRLRAHREKLRNLCDEHGSTRERAELATSDPTAPLI